MPIHEIDWRRREEDDVFSCTKDVLARTTNWIKSKIVATLDLTRKFSKSKSKRVPKKKKKITNQDIHDAIAGIVEVKAKVVPKPLQVQVQEGTPKTKRVTHSSTRKTLTTKIKGTIIVDLKVT